MSDDRTETMHSSDSPPRASESIGVLTLSGATDHVARSVTRTLVVGRDAECDLAIDDSRVSKRHAEISPRGRALQVRDLESRNGTFVDGTAVEGERTAPPGSVIRVGRALLLVVADSHAHRDFGAAAASPIVGGRRVTEIARRVRATASASSAPILIEGESGTGKELFAKLAHDATGRSGELVVLNCAALPKDLVEAELFGHAKGAFSGADKARAGLFRRADGGTLFLDELGELPLPAQAKLLRVLEDGLVRGVGEDRAVYADVRLVAATNRKLETAVEGGAFRADLFHRLSAHRFSIPPLRARIEDLVLLAAHFLREDAHRLSVTALERLLLHPWPGNVRELRNVLESARIAADSEGSETIAPEHVPIEAQARAAAAPQADPEDAILRERLVTALELRRGNVSVVARDLGVRRQAVYDDMRRLGIDPSRYR
jgi:DNA-binding NtrC family response regulator